MGKSGGEKLFEIEGKFIDKSVEETRKRGNDGQKVEGRYGQRKWRLNGEETDAAVERRTKGWGDQIIILFQASGKLLDFSRKTPTSRMQLRMVN